MSSVNHRTSWWCDYDTYFHWLTLSHWLVVSCLKDETTFQQNYGTEVSSYATIKNRSKGKHKPSFLTLPRARSYNGNRFTPKSYLYFLDDARSCFRLDFFEMVNSRRSPVTMGLAVIAGVCSPKYSCVIGELGTTNSQVRNMWDLNSQVRPGAQDKVWLLSSGQVRTT